MDHALDCRREVAIAPLIEQRSDACCCVLFILGEVSIISVKDRLIRYVVGKSHSAVSTDHDAVAVQEVNPGEWVEALLEQEFGT